MNPLAKLAGFAVAAAIIFAGAAFAGSRIDVRPGRPAPEKTGMHTMAAGGAAAMAPQPCAGWPSATRA